MEEKKEKNIFKSSTFLMSTFTRHIFAMCMLRERACECVSVCEYVYLSAFVRMRVCVRDIYVHAQICVRVSAYTYKCAFASSCIHTEASQVSPRRCPHHIWKGIYRGQHRARWFDRNHAECTYSRANLEN